tara:strand:- start:13394 stop:13711 length:318 start_codon:yes stop_codon:yes gene_type:complete
METVQQDNQVGRSASVLVVCALIEPVSNHHFLNGTLQAYGIGYSMHCKPVETAQTANHQRKANIFDSKQRRSASVKGHLNNYFIAQNRGQQARSQSFRKMKWPVF